MSDFGPLIAQAAQQYNLDPNIIRSLVNVESSRNPNAVNPTTGASGLLQFIPATAKAYGINPLDPAQAINAGAKMFRENLDRFGGDVPSAVAAHFAGPDQAQWGPKTSAYVQKVASVFNGLQNNTGTPVAQPTPAASPSVDAWLGNAPPTPATGSPDVAAWLGQTAPAPAHAAPAAAVPPVAQSAGQSINSSLADIPRQLGLTARYGLEGLAQAAQVFTEPLRYITDGFVPDRKPDPATGQTPPKSTPLGVQATKFANFIGLPQPQTANERVVGDAARLVAGAGSMVGGAGAAAEVPGLIGKVTAGLSANPVAQLSSAAGAGLAGGASREAGGTTGMQTAASLVGGIAGGLAPGAIGAVYSTAKNLLTPALTVPQMDVRLTTILGNAGQDYSALPDSVKAGLRSDLASALKTGKDLSPDALSRLAAFRQVGATPTQGMLSQNPVQITREQNLAKIAANNGDSQLHGLPLMQNQNNSTLIQNLNGAGATAGDAFKAGQGIAGSVLGTNQGLVNARDAAYAAAREMPGAKNPIYPDAVSNIFNALDEKGIVGDLPSTIGSYLNAFVGGAKKGPLGEVVPPPAFNVQAYENLQKQLSNAAMSSDSATRYAAGVARRALENTPIQPITQTGIDLGTTPITQATAGLLQARDGQAQALLDQLNAGRAAHKSLMQFGESSPVVSAIVNGAQPDNLFSKFVLGGTVADAQSVAQNAPNAGVKEAIVSYLKDKALNGASDEVGKFSQSGYNKALSGIGDQKLGLFFNPEEIANLKAVGRVSGLMQSQPVGSAVNNSNSGALVLGKGADWLGAAAGKFPMGKQLISDPLRNINISLTQRAAQNVGNGLLVPQIRPPMINSLILPGAAAAGGLLAP